LAADCRPHPGRDPTRPFSSGRKAWVVPCTASIVAAPCSSVAGTAHPSALIRMRTRRPCQQTQNPGSASPATNAAPPTKRCRSELRRRSHAPQLATAAKGGDVRTAGTSPCTASDRSIAAVSSRERRANSISPRRAATKWQCGQIVPSALPCQRWPFTEARKEDRRWCLISPRNYTSPRKEPPTGPRE